MSYYTVHTGDGKGNFSTLAHSTKYHDSALRVALIHTLHKGVPVRVTKHDGAGEGAKKKHIDINPGDHVKTAMKVFHQTNECLEEGTISSRVAQDAIQRLQKNPNDKNRGELHHIIWKRAVQQALKDGNKSQKKEA